MADRIFALPAEGGRLLPPAGPGRLLAAGILARAVGLGGVLPTVAVFFVHSVGLSGGEVGVGMSLASVLGLAASVPAGRLADRWGARRMLIWLPVAGGVTFGSYALVHSFTGFLLAGGAVAVCLSATRVAEATLVGIVLDGQNRVRFRAYLGSVHNLGFALGVLAMAIPLQVGTRSGYLVFIAASALVTAASALATWRLPASPHPRGQRLAVRLTAVRDLPYLAVSVLTGLTVVRNQLMTIAAPLWVIGHTGAPSATIPVLLVLNAALVVCLQVHAARGTQSPWEAARVNIRGGAALLLACLLLGLCSGVPAAATTVLLLFATAVFTFGEMWTAAAAWSLSYDLADPRAAGDYQGVFGMGRSLSELAGPVMATGVVALGTAGWALAGVAFLLLTVLTRFAVEWSRRSAAKPVTEEAIGHRPARA